MILRARESRRQAAFNRAAALPGSTLPAIDAAIAAAIAAGQTSIVVTTPIVTDVTYIREQGYQLNSEAANTTQTKIGWASPTDAGADF